MSKTINTSTDSSSDDAGNQHHNFALKSKGDNIAQEEVERHEHTTLSTPRKKLLVAFGIWALFTGWWIAGLVLHHSDKNWVVPFLLWLCIAVRVITLRVPASTVLQPMYWTWNHVNVALLSQIPGNVQTMVLGSLTIITIALIAFVPSDSGQNTRASRAISLLGLATFVFVLWATSRNRKKIKWRRVIVGMLVQILVALFVLRTSAGYDIFSFVSTLARDLLGFAADGLIFLTDPNVTKLGWFLVAVVPAIIFFVTLVRVLNYYGFIPWVVGKFAVFFRWSMNVSGAEAVAAAACPFVGQGENAVLITPFLPYLSKAEIHQVMCSGFGTIAGSVLGAYIGLGVNPQALVSSCVMSIPASLAFSHLRYPEEEEDNLTAAEVRIHQSNENRPANGLHAFADGAWLGLKVAGMIVANVLCITATIALIDGLLTWWGRYINLNGEYDLTVELIVGYVCYPIAFLLGVPRNHELLLIGRLIGIKIVANEFVAYTALVSQPEYVAMSERSQLIATYALCGFGNFAAVGTQIGVLSQIAPTRSRDVSRIAVSALLTGVLSTLSSAAIAGIIIEDQAEYTS